MFYTCIQNNKNNIKRDILMAKENKVEFLIDFEIEH